MRLERLLVLVLPPLALASDAESPYKLNMDLNSPLSVEPFSLPTKDLFPVARAAALGTKKQGIRYGPGPDQNLTAYPAGPIGMTMWRADLANLNVEQERHTYIVNQDLLKAAAALEKAGGLRSLQNYSILYQGQWKESMGNLVDPSYFRNFTQDLFFSMQRLTINPFVVRRLVPQERLPFYVDDGAVRQVSTLSLQDLFDQGRLFYVDYRHLASIARIPGRFSAACEAYFYIHPHSGDFLPLAVKTNEGRDLVYTPADSPGDWLMAKILFGQNDVWDTPWRHFASTHLVLELPYLAAQRCMSDSHPILAVYRRLMVNAFALRWFIQTKLYAPGQFVDRLFPFDGAAATEYTMHLYRQGEDKFQANYFPTRLQRQGLLDSAFGPPLKHFPFVEDASKIESAFRSFMKVLVDSYYAEPDSLSNDDELACWFKEARAAGSRDFPGASDITKPVLVDILTHVAYLGGVQHQTMNNNDEFINALLPLSPMALYRPLPINKGLTEDDILAFLPSAAQSLNQISLSAAFSRPEFIGSDRCLMKAFDNADLLWSLNDETREAADDFKAAMRDLSQKIEGLSFDAHGLCRGAPFKWQALNPKVALYAMSI